MPTEIKAQKKQWSSVVSSRAKSRDLTVGNPVDFRVV